MKDSPGLILVCQESPWPARHGGTVDMLRRLKALHASGVRVFLIAWSEEPAKAGLVEELSKYAEWVEILPYQRGFKQRFKLLGKFFKYPGPVCTRWVFEDKLTLLLNAAKGFGAGHVMQDGLMAGGLARVLAKQIGLKLLVRSHNIEHLYWRQQCARARGLTWLKIRLRLVGLERFERDGLRLAARFFDISADDLLAWQRRGLINGLWLPPIVAVDTVDSADFERKPDFDLAFVGNLRMPNNVEGVRWLLDEVVPVLSKRLGRPVRTLVAGSAPSPEIVHLIERSPQTVLLADFEHLGDVLASARVLVNPMLAGSGVALKTVDMLLSGRSVVSTSQGVSGLPSELKALIHIGDSTEAFAEALADSIVEERSLEQARDQRELVSTLFGPAAILPLLNVLAGEEALG